MDIIAHRGASHDAPENTLAAARLAWAQGADALELDVHLTRDGQLAVVHDEDLQRVAGMPCRVAAATLAELQRFDVGRWKGEAFAGEKVPALGDVLAAVPGGKRVFVEIKGGAEAVAALERSVSSSGRRHGDITIISFDRTAVASAKQALPKCEACWIIDSAARLDSMSLESRLQICRELGLNGLDFEAGWPIDAGFVDQIHRRGLRIYVWTVDDPAIARRLAAAAVDGIATNRPGWMRGQLSAARTRG